MCVYVCESTLFPYKSRVCAGDEAESSDEHGNAFFPPVYFPSEIRRRGANFSLIAALSISESEPPNRSREIAITTSVMSEIACPGR